MKTSLFKWFSPFQVFAVMLSDVNKKYSDEGSNSTCPGEKGD